MRHSPYNFILVPWRRLVLSLMTLSLLFTLSYTVFHIETKELGELPRTLVLVDTSLSSSAEDIEGQLGVQLSRLDASKELIRELALSGTQFALASFSDSARLQLPFSTDKGLWNDMVSALSPVNYGSATAIETALLFVTTLYPDVGMNIVVVTDGEETSASSLTGITLAGAQHLIFVGVGTEAGARLVSHYDGTGQRVYKRYNGQEIVSRLDTNHLQELRDRYDADLYYLDQTADIGMIVADIRDTLSSKKTESDAHTLLIILSGLLLIVLMLPAWQIHSPTGKKSSSSSR